ncbi:hypothetical protein F8M41_026457 [Gigaspora margarita]|uniref:Uncharacterized protein n=1 Tax=Gigaspora margarita TaxID=4874 RepID=A0A8H4A9A9_GIGMA|nr:hypothetical protein F8M41_026457 [Gigaspora margarita]
MNTNFDYSEYLLQPLSLSIYYLSPQVELLKKLYTIYADTEVDSAGQERKRLRTNENDKVAIKGASPIITSNIRDPTQSEPNKQRTLENQEEPSSRMVLRKQKKELINYKNSRSKR